jgi:hypothetical protein
VYKKEGKCICWKEKREMKRRGKRSERDEAG